MHDWACQLLTLIFVRRFEPMIRELREETNQRLQAIEQLVTTRDRYVHWHLLQLCLLRRRAAATVFAVVCACSW